MTQARTSAGSRSQEDASPAPTRWFGVGASHDPEPAAAAAAAIATARRGTDARLALVFCSPRYPLGELVSAIGTLIPDVPMIGCTTAGEIADGRTSDQGLVIAILGGAFEIATTCARDASDDLFAAGGRAASVMTELPPSDHRVLLLLTDGLAGDQQEIVRGAYAEVGAGVPLVGGCAGDDLAMAGTFQFVDGEIHANAVVAAAIGSASPIGIGVRHGWRPVGDPMLVTRSAGTTVHEFDDAPALDVYLDRLAAPSAVRRDPALFAPFAMTHPLGLRRRSSEEVRFVNGADLASRSLTSVAEVPEGSLVWIMEGDRDSVLAGTTASCQQALAALGGHEPIGLVLFDCIGRRGVLDPASVSSETAAILQCAPAVPFAGFYTYGEIARTRGVRGFHNQTLVTLALS